MATSVEEIQASFSLLKQSLCDLEGKERIGERRRGEKARRGEGRKKRMNERKKVVASYLTNQFAFCYISAHMQFAISGAQASELSPFFVIRLLGSSCVP